MGRVQRKVRKTVLGVAEGKRDVGFLKYLKKLYHCPEVDVSIKSGYGGCPEKIVQTCIKLSHDRQYDIRYAMYDTDRGEEENSRARALATNNGVLIIESAPNIETALIEQLGTAEQVKRARCNSHEAKKILAQICHLGGDLDGDIDFARYLPKELVNKKRVGNQWLEDLIRIFEG